MKQHLQTISQVIITQPNIALCTIGKTFNPQVIINDTANINGLVTPGLYWWAFNSQKFSS
jgi:hypothetical protein